MRAHEVGNGLGWRWGVSIGAVSGLMLGVMQSEAIAQVTPDDTLGAEGSVVTENVLVQGVLANLIEGGAIRDTNLFHSFLEFNVGEGERVYFDNPEAIANIFSRVTGADPSNILGTLGVDGAANLFFLNPNGIIFGPNASLDIEGSFVGTTADAIQFGEEGFYSATEPEASSLLTIDPSALLFNQFTPSEITNNSTAFVGVSPAGNLLFGLRAANDRSLLLVGGDINVAGGRIVGSGSRIELGGLAQPGTVGLEADGGIFKLNFSDQSVRSNVNLTNDGLVGLIGSRGGDIVVNADVLTGVDGGRLVAVIEGEEDGSNITVAANQVNFSGVGLSFQPSGLLSRVLPNATGNAGEIDVVADSISIRDGAEISSVTFGTGNAGNVDITADSVEVVGISENRQSISVVASSSASFAGAIATGDAGDVTITTRLLSVRDGARISTETASRGAGGTLFVTVRESTQLAGSGDLLTGVNSSGLTTQTTGSADAGNLTLETGALLIQNGASITASTSGPGSAGDINITADSIRLTGVREDRLFSSAISSSSAPPFAGAIATGDAGDVNISTRELSVREGAAISTGTSSEGQGGNLSITASEATEVVGSGILANGQVNNSSLSAETRGSGTAGNLTLETSNLNIRGGGNISAATFGSGNAGNINITADSIEVIGVSENNPFSSAIGSTSDINQFIGQVATGNAGDVILSTQFLSIREGGAILASTFGTGNAGSVDITADSIEVIGTSENGQQISRILSNSTGNALTGELATGDAGDITISARVLSIQDGAGISTGTSGEGQGGNLLITARESTEVVGSAVLVNGQVSNSNLSTGTQGFRKAGDLTLETDNLNIRDGGNISAATFGSGNAGNINITADSIEVIGVSENNPFSSAIGSTSDINQFTGQAVTGNAGDVTIFTRELSVREGAAISTGTSSEGQGGNLSINASESTEVVGSGILANGQVNNSNLSAETQGSQTAGNLILETENLSVRDGGNISAATFGSGNAGNIDITADSIEVAGVSENNPFSSVIASTSDINQFTRQAATGDAGNVTLSTQFLSIHKGGAILASTFGSGNAGNINITADSVEVVGISENGQRISSILSNSTGNTLTGELATGDAGDVTISTRVLSVREGAAISTGTLSEGRGGNLFITGRESIEVVGSGILANGQVNNSNLSAETQGSQTAGNLILETGNLIVQNGGGILASTFDSGDAGNVNIVADSIEVIGVSENGLSSSFIGSASEINPFTGRVATGDAGNVTINTRVLSVRDGGAISTTTFGEGRGGNLDVAVQELAEFIGSSPLSNELLAQSGLFTATAGSGNAGRVRLFARNLVIQDGSVISTVTGGEGNAGRIRLSISQDISIRGVGGEDGQLSSGITSSILPGGQGNAGDVFIRANALSIEDGGQIAAIVSRPQQALRDIQGEPFNGGRGRAGNIQLIANDSITLSGISTNGFSSGILALTERGARGRGGNISVSTRDLRVEDGAIIVASTFNPSSAGNIVINAESVELLEGGQIVTNTRNSGDAGRITLNVLGDVIIEGVDANFRERLGRVQAYVQLPNISDRPSDVIVNQERLSGIFANTEIENSTGNGGSIRLTASNLQILDRGAIVTQSEGEGLAGTITVNINDQLEMVNGEIVTEALQSSGGDIQINTGEGFGSGVVLLRGDSDITTSSRNNGGNIAIRGAWIIAFDDSDILAFAREGRGGNVTLDTPAFFGENFTPISLNADPDGLDNNDRVDINATGAVSGTVLLPDVSFIQNSLNDLPTSLINTEDLIANSCVVQNADGSSTFIITGSGGLPERPGDAVSDYPTGEVQAIPEDSNSSTWQPGDPILEPQGVYQLPNGELVLSHLCSS